MKREVIPMFTIVHLFKFIRIHMLLILLLGFSSASTLAGHLPIKGLAEYGGFPGQEMGEPGPEPPQSPRASSSNIQLLGHADPGGGFNADVVSHRGHAYMGSWGTGFGDGSFCPSYGVRVFSLTDPTNPTLVSTFADGSEPGATSLAGTWTEKVIVKHVNTSWMNGDLAAVSIQSCAPGSFRGFGLWDVTDPANPVRLGLYETEAATMGSHEIWLEATGNRAYVYTAIILSEWFTSPDGATPGRADFRIVDVSDPTNPTDLAEWGAWKELGVPPQFMDENGVIRVNFVHSIIGDGKRAYLSYWDFGTVILDVSDPANPEYLGRTSFADHEAGNAHSSWLARGGNILIQTDEDFDPSPHPVLEASWGYARFFDISDPSNPVQLSTFKLPSTTQFPPPSFGFFSVHDPKVRGSLAYFSWYAEGVVIVDISQPENPRFVAQFLPEPAADPFGLFAPADVEFINVWGVVVEQNYVLASDINSGLWVFQVR
jgi:hypothetical protein